jgi:aspartyl-tRNA(Asn)/glutamyl-tRNA(Gln) amidotransferase subunit C
VEVQTALADEITREQVRHVAMLARLGLSPEDEERFTRELAHILEAIRAVQELDLSGVEATAQAVRTVNITRPDEPGASLSQEEALANAPEPHDGFFAVPSIGV